MLSFPLLPQVLHPPPPKWASQVQLPPPQWEGRWRKQEPPSFLSFDRDLTASSFLLLVMGGGRGLGLGTGRGWLENFVQSWERRRHEKEISK